MFVDLLYDCVIVYVIARSERLGNLLNRGVYEENHDFIIVIVTCFIIQPGLPSGDVLERREFL